MDTQETAKQITRNLIRALKIAGWEIVAVKEDEYRENVTGERAAMDLIFNLSEPLAIFKKEGMERGQTVLLIPSNGCDVISNYSANEEFAGIVGAVIDGI